MTFAHLPPTPLPTPSVSSSPDCVHSSDLCDWVYQQTHNVWLASGSYVVVIKPLRILLIIVAALVIRYLLHRTINRLVRTTASGVAPAMLRPLKERLPSALQDATSVFPERRRQRAEAIGSVLRSSATAVVFSIAGLMVLAELGVNLAPLLASAGIAGIAFGFGAQSLVKDLLAGLFMLLEDQYGVGDVVDVGEASGTVEAVGLRITTIRDARGVLWYIRNGEIVRVGNKSQGWAVVMVDVPVDLARVEQATAILREAAAAMAADPEVAPDLLEGPDVLGVEQITVEGAMLRTTVKTNADAQWRIGRELRRRLTDAVAGTGVSSAVPAGRVYIQQPTAPAPARTDSTPEAEPVPVPVEVTDSTPLDTGGGDDSGSDTQPKPAGQ